MPLGWPRTGAQYSTAFVVSGVPWVTGSLSVAGVTKIAFPNVTRDFTVANTGGGELRVGFTLNGVTGSNYFTVAASSEKVMELRIRDLYISGTSTCDVLAGLTSISRNEYPNITGSNPAPTGSQYIPGIG